MDNSVSTAGSTPATGGNPLPTPQRLLAGRYHIGKLIGRGGMADVHLGTDSRLGRTVAIKLLKSSLANDPAFRTRFRQEAQAAARMAHPTVVRVFDAGEETVMSPTGTESQVPFIVMEYVDGRLLKDIIHEGPLAPAESVHIVEGILTALEYSHRAGVVHRDIKPGNIMITRNGQVKVMDFGIARAISDSSATVAQTTAILGTAQYFSPEQARGESVDARTDLYSTGIVLFEMLTGRPPFRGDSPVAVAYQHVSEQPDAPSAINPKVSPAMDSVVLRALAKDRFERYQSAAEFRQDVQLAAAGRLPTRKLPQPDFSATLFGAPELSGLNSDTALRQLAVDDNSRVRTQNRPPAVWIWAGIASIAVIVLAVVFWVVTLSPNTALPDDTSKVPALIGVSQADAEKALQDLDLVPVAHDEASTIVPEGQVIRTDPEAGALLSPQTTVNLYVSTGRAVATIPDVSGQDQAAATAALKVAGLEVGSVTKEHSPDQAAGVVLRTDPLAVINGVPTPVREGDTINLVVSDGLVSLPDLRSLQLTDARAQLDQLQLRTRVEASNDCGPAATVVIAQSLAPGDVPQRSEITLNYCSGSGNSGAGNGDGADG